MDLPTIIALGALGAVVALVITLMIINKKKGKSSCSCGCGGCAFKESCHQKKKK